MARPKKGEKGCEEATRKWRETILKKYGNEEELRKKFIEIGRKGGLNGRGPNYKGGFASENSKARIAGAKGGRISRRGFRYIKKEDNVAIYQNKNGDIVEFEIKGE